MDRTELLRARIKAAYDDCLLFKQELAGMQEAEAGEAQERAMRFIESAIADARGQVRYLRQFGVKS